MIHVLTAYQLELYETLRFLRFIYTHPKYWIHGGERQSIVWTPKARFLFILSIILMIGIISLLVVFMSPIFIVFGCIIAIIAYPIILIIAHMVLAPLDYFLKKKIIKKAKEKLSLYKKNLTIIGITGSYGKTSQKEILETILGKKYKILTTEGNKNTPLGIADTIEKKLSHEHEIFIVEMGAYKKGNIREICDLVNPNIAILTGITYQHLERFGSIDTIIRTKYELPESIDESGLIILDSSNNFVKEGLKSRQSILRGKVLEPRFPEHIKYKDDFTGIEFDYSGIHFTTSLLADHSAHPIIIACEVARYLGMEDEEIQHRIKDIKPVEHRLEPIYNPTSNVWVIDDSYNGNIEGVRSTVRLLANTLNHRRLYLTPGLVELGKESESIHFEIGKLLAPVADKVLLIDSPQTRAIRHGLLDTGYSVDNIITYPDTQTAHTNLPQILESGDVIVFQNDWSDNYF